MGCKMDHERWMQDVLIVRVKVHWSTATGLSSDSDDTPLARLGIQSPEGGTTVRPSEYLGEFRSPAVTVTEEPVHRESAR